MAQQQGCNGIFLNFWICWSSSRSPCNLHVLETRPRAHVFVFLWLYSYPDFTSKHQGRDFLSPRRTMRKQPLLLYDLRWFIFKNSHLNSPKQRKPTTYIYMSTYPLNRTATQYVLSITCYIFKIHLRK